MELKISPSMMCANPKMIDETLSTFEMEHIALLHVDIMDGIFVPNTALNENDAKQYHRYSIPLDYHLMVINPLERIDDFDLKKNDYMSIHLESTKDVKECLAKIKRKGAKAGLAISPDTPAESIIPYLDDIDYVLVMCVYPGFAGQSLVEGSFEKIRKVRELLDSYHKENIEIEVDGNVSFVNAPKMRQSGANIFVAGSSSVFRKDMQLESAIRLLKEAIK